MLQPFASWEWFWESRQAPWRRARINRRWTAPHNSWVKAWATCVRIPAAFRVFGRVIQIRSPRSRLGASGRPAGGPRAIVPGMHHGVALPAGEAFFHEIQAAVI